MQNPPHEDAKEPAIPNVNSCQLPSAVMALSIPPLSGPPLSDDPYIETAIAKHVSTHRIVTSIERIPDGLSAKDSAQPTRVQTKKRVKHN
jgi:hypothetical protein